MNVGVIGAGVIGLSTAILLMRKGYSVTVYAMDLPPNTTSDKACALWLPILVGEPELMTATDIELYRLWAEISWMEFEQLIGSDWGVYWTRLYEMFPEKEPRPYFADIVRDFEEGYDFHLPPGLTYKWSLTTMIVETPIYLPALLKHFQEIGGIIIQKVITKDNLRGLQEDVVFNCSGLGSRELFADNELCPVKGQLLLHEPLPLDFSLGAGEYGLIPRTDTLVLGSIFEHEFDSVEPNEADTKRIWETIETWLECISNEHIPRIQIHRDKIKAIITGLRPYRPHGIRLQAETVAEKLIVHDYGHGGGGITFSWGCAEYSIELMESIMVIRSQDG